MKAIAGCLLGALVMLLVGVGCLGAGLLDRELVRAFQQVVSGRYDEPHAVFDEAERYYEQASLLPWIGNGAANDIRTRAAALHYWKRQYGEIIPQAAEPVGNIPLDNISLQFVVANGVFRNAARGAKDRAASLAALESGINAYRTVLKNSTRHHDAAYNYEYLWRLHDEIEQGRRKALPSAEVKTSEGRAGSQPVNPDANTFKMYIPLEQQEIEKSKAAAAGKAAPIKRKG
jgi:hypothetical protein